MIAQYANKPLYVVVESYKFVRQFPLSQSDLPSPLQLDYKDSFTEGEEVNVAKASVDYTPPGLISLLLTDFGILSPSDISEHLFFLENR